MRKRHTVRLLAVVGGCWRLLAVVGGRTCPAAYPDRPGRRACPCADPCPHPAQANQGEAGPGWTDAAIGAALEVNPATVARVHTRYAAEGLEAAVDRKATEREREDRRRLDGEHEASLLALVCGAPPKGRQRWTLRLLAERLVALEVVESVSYETVRQVLQQTGSSRT